MGLRLSRSQAVLKVHNVLEWNDTNIEEDLQKVCRRTVTSDREAESPITRETTEKLKTYLTISALTHCVA